MADDPTTLSETVIAVLASIPVVSGIAIYLRGRAETARIIKEAADKFEAKVDHLTARHDAHVKDVSENRASNAYVAAVERRVDARFDRLEDSLSDRFDKIEGMLLSRLAVPTRGKDPAS